MTIARQLGGMKAKRIGDLFEDLFARCCQRYGVILTVIPDGARTVYRQGKVQLIRVTTPFDFFLTKGGKSAAVDCKTIQAGRFPASKVDPQQLRELLKVSASIKAGYVVCFRDVNKVVFFSAQQLARLKARASLGPDDGLSLGTDSQHNPELILHDHQISEADLRSRAPEA